MAQLQSLIVPGEPLVTLDLDQNGAFVLHNPPAGLFLVEIRHPHLVNAAKVEVQVRRGQHQDLGSLATRMAGTLLVLVSGPEGRPVSKALLQLHRKMDMSRFMRPDVATDITGLMREMMPLRGRTDEQPPADSQPR